jgi:hypothetical protein
MKRRIGRLRVEVAMRYGIIKEAASTSFSVTNWRRPLCGEFKASAVLHTGAIVHETRLQLAASPTYPGATPDMSAPQGATGKPVKLMGMPNRAQKLLI